jgi:PTS system ascorbate-specific IIA component
VSVGIVIVTHGGTARSLIAEAGFVLGQEFTGVYALEFNHSKNPTSVAQIRSCLEQADSGDGVLVLTDLMGASPANLVSEALEECHAVMVTGVNLAMLIRAFNYRGQSLELVVQKAAEGGKRAVKIFQA